MRSIGFPPGSNNFRLLMIVVIVGALWLFFFDYTNQISVKTERASVQQTKNIINSTLSVVFATYAVKGELDRLSELVGANPFEQLAAYNVITANYLGQISLEDLDGVDPGWYYDRLNREVIYKPFYDDQIYYFSMILDYIDVNGSGQFESATDDYRRLYFGRLP